MKSFIVVDIQGLINIRLIERTESYSIEYGICYSYRISSDILEESENYYFKTIESIQSLRYSNLITSRKIIKARKSSLRDLNDNKSPELVCDGIIGIKRTVYNYKQLAKYINDASKGIKTEKDAKKYLNDLRCFELIVKDSKDINEDLKYYIPAYEAQRSGRSSIFFL